MLAYFKWRSFEFLDDPDYCCEICVEVGDAWWWCDGVVKTIYVDLWNTHQRQTYNYWWNVRIQRTVWGEEYTRWRQWSTIRPTVSVMSRDGMLPRSYLWLVVAALVSMSQWVTNRSNLRPDVKPCPPLVNKWTRDTSSTDFTSWNHHTRRIRVIFSHNVIQIWVQHW